ncbi:MAG TPA: hypothetical protein VI039_12790 [Solirubrobacterales bacterium]
MKEIEVHLAADSLVQDEARLMDWGALVTSGQGGVGVFVVGLPPDEAAALLRKAADALESER